MSKFNAFLTTTINIDATHIIRSAVLTLVYLCSCVSLFAVVAERLLWFQDHHGDTVMCWMQFLACVHNTRKVIPFLSDVQTDQSIWSFFSIRNRLYVVSDAPKLKNAANARRDDGGHLPTCRSR
jgi:hypothetical protein